MFYKFTIFFCNVVVLFVLMNLTSCQFDAPPETVSQYLYDGDDIVSSSHNLQNILMEHPDARIYERTSAYTHLLKIRPEKKWALFRKINREICFVREFEDMIPKGIRSFRNDARSTLHVEYPDEKAPTGVCRMSIPVFLSEEERKLYFERSVIWGDPDGREIDWYWHDGSGYLKD